MSTSLINFLDEHKGIAAALDRLRLAVEAGKRMAEGSGGLPFDYAAAEIVISDCGADIERESHAALLPALDMTCDAIVVDGRKLVRSTRETTTYFSMAGEVVVCRNLFRDPDDLVATAVDPIALRIGIIAGSCLPHTARAIAHEIQQRPSREVESSGRETRRLKYSRSTLERIGHAVGSLYVSGHKEIEQILSEAYEVPKEAASVSVSLDRVALPMEEPRPRPVGRPRKDAPKRPIARVHHMAYCATVTYHDISGEAIHTMRFGCMPDGDVDELCDRLKNDVDSAMSAAPHLHLSLLCDGAHENWNLLERRFPSAGDEGADTSLATRVTSKLIDFWHLIEKLTPAAKLIHDDEASKVMHRWRMRLLNFSDAGKYILNELIGSGMENVYLGEKRPVHDAITYLTNHKDRLDYATARRLGLPIGSGNVEATCKSLIKVRMDRSGARWKDKTGEEIIQLRSLALSDRWDQGISLALARLPRAAMAA